MGEYESKVLKYKRSLIKELFDLLPEEQKTRFIKWVGDIDFIKEEDLKAAYNLLKRSIEKNIKIVQQALKEEGISG